MEILSVILSVSLNSPLKLKCHCKRKIKDLRLSHAGKAEGIGTIEPGAVETSVGLVVLIKPMKNCQDKRICLFH